MKKQGYFCAGSTLAVAMSLVALQAQAQTAPAGQAAASNATTLSDLVVTAERREQRLETVPVAVSAFSAEQRTLVGIQGFQDLTNFTPGFHYQAAADRPYMRGIGRNTDNLAVASAVAIYYNGIYKGANATILLQHSDLFVDTIEVDRGPQNTLHGANADGGTINYISKKPTKEYYAEGRAGVANNERYWGEAVVSGPITDWLRFRLGANATVENGGFFKNLNGDKQGGSLPQQTAGNSQYLEAQLEGNFGDHLEGWAMINSGTFSADYHQNAVRGAIPNNFQFNGAFSPSDFFGLCGLPDVATSPGGANGCLTGPAGGPPQVVIPGSVTGGPVFANAFPGNNPSTADPRTFIQEMTSTNKQRADLALATTWTYHFPSFDVQYLGGYEDFNYVLNFSNDADAGVTSYQTAGASGPGLCFADAAGAGYNPALCTQPLTIFPAPNTTFFQEKDHFFTHEVDFTSTTNSPLQWIGGFYFYHEKYDQPVWAGVQPNQTQLAHPFYIGAGGSLIPAPANPASAISTSDTQLEYNSWAVFGHVDYKFSDAWKAHLGVRYTRDHKFGEQFWRFEEFDTIFPFVSAGFPGTAVNGFGAATPGLDVTPIATEDALGVSFPGAGPASIDPNTGFAHRQLDAKWNAWTGDAGVDWTPDEDTLVYAKYSRGYKAGGFSTFTLAPNPQTQAETVDAFEGGVKKTIAQQFRINAAAFWYDYKNDQIPLSVQNAQGLIATQLFNLKSVHIYGIELEALWQPMDDLLINAQYSHLSAKVHDPGACFEDTIDPTASLSGADTSGCSPASLSATGALVPATQNLEGNQLPEAPPNKISLNAIYTLHFDPGKLALSGTYVWKDKTYGSLFNRPYSLAPQLNLVNLRAVWTGNNNRYNVIVYVDNVFDKTNVDAQTGSLLVAPTTTGQVGQIVNNNFLLNPRTYGIELRYRFP